MKKRLTAILLLILISIGVIIFIFFTNSHNLSIDRKIEVILETAFISNYEEYAEFDKFEKLEKYEMFNKIRTKKENEVKSFFNEEGFGYIKRLRLMTESAHFVEESKCNTEIASLEIDIRDTTETNVKVCYFTLLVKVDYVEESKETVYSEISGVVSIHLVDEEWVIGMIQINSYPLWAFD